MNNKPLTAEDLVVGNKYELNDLVESQICEYKGLIKDKHRFEGVKDCFDLSNTQLIRCVTPYHEPNQTTMNTDYTEQPFNLETALKHPEWVYFRNGEKPLEWHWFEKSKSHFPICCIGNYEHTMTHMMNGRNRRYNESPDDLILRVPYREIHVRILENGKAYWDYTDYGSNPIENAPDLIACVPVKIPAI